MLFDNAVSYAVQAHIGQKRKGKDKPYILHPMEVAAIVGSMTLDQEVLAAAVLHDTIEDTVTTKEDLKRLFGQRVADLVADESEDKRDDLPAEDTWELRKSETIEHLKHASRDAKLICLGDKLSNLREMRSYYKEIGKNLWDRFNQHDPAKHGWYYGNILEILADEFGEDCPAIQEYRRMIEEIFG